MADEHAQDDEVLDLEEDQIIEPDEEETGGDEQQDDDEVVAFADEEAAEPAPAENDLVKHLRQQIRDRDKRLAETAKAAPAEPEIVVGDKPTQEGCDWDMDRYERERDAWEDRKIAAAKQASKREQAQAAQAEQWNKVTQEYQAKKAALRYPDKDVAEQKVLDTISPAAQALIARHADNPALFIYAVGKSDMKLAELARIDAEGDPFAVVKTVTKMEANLTTKRSGPRPPDPDRPVRGKVISATIPDKQLAKLTEEARATGDRSKLIAYKSAQKEKAK